MMKKIKDVITDLNKSANDIENAYNAGVVEGFDQKS